MVVFALEYALRLLSAHHHRDHSGSRAPALSFVFSLYSLIDLLTIAPYFWTLAYPGGSGPFGTWGFDENSYTPTQDYRVIWWDPDAVSPQNNKRGAYIEAYDGRRFEPGAGELPASNQPPVFGR